MESDVRRGGALQSPAAGPFHPHAQDLRSGACCGSTQMTRQELVDLLAGIRQVRVGIVGDFCLDVYLLLEPGAAEISLETGLSTRPVRTQRYSLGGAGNVASNLRAMGATRLSA